MREKMQRFDTYMKFKGLNDNQVTTECHLSQGLIGQARTGKSDLGPSAIDRILKAYQDLNRVWLLTGEGEMLKSAPNGGAGGGDYPGTLVYDIDATCGMDGRDMMFAEDRIIGSVKLPGISNEAVIVRANGDSMEPRIFDGNLVAIREIKNWNDLFYGQIYLVLLDEYRMIKYIRKDKEDEENYIILHSENALYDDIRLHKSKIRKLFIVESILAVKVQL